MIKTGHRPDKQHDHGHGLSTGAPALELSLGQRAALKGIRLYQLILSPWIGRQCRFYPTCSHYAGEAIVTHGLGRGMWLAAKRLGRCHPFNPGGVDLVPQAHRHTPHGKGEPCN